MSDTRYAVERLQEFTVRVFGSLGVPAADAVQAADVLVTADRRGIDSHGVSRLPLYADMIVAGRINPRPNLRVVRELPGTATVDGDGGLGLVVGPWANALAAEKADAVGTGWVAACNSSHFGIAGYYPLQAVSRGLIGWAMSNAAKLVAPPGGAERLLGTNPIAAAFPAGEEPPVVIDLATSAAAFGKLQIALRAGRPIPEGWSVDRDGLPTIDPRAVPDGGALLPLGSTAELGAHKGFCLAALADLMCGVLSGACWGPFVPAFVVKQPVAEPTAGRGVGHFFGALRIDGFADPDEFRARVDQWVRTVRAAPPAPGSTGVQAPGDPERRAEAERCSHGVPLPASLVVELRALGERTGVLFD